MTGLFIFFYAIIIILFIRTFYTTKIANSTLTDSNELKHGHCCYIEGLSPAEKEVVDTLAHNLDHKEYFIFNNLILPSANGGSTQIDHIIISRYGIFVIESKKFKGWIYGHQNRSSWTQTFKNGKKFHFHNPLLQNFGHVATLKSLMPYVAKHVHSIVVFSGECEFMTPRIDNVLYLEELVDYIQRFRERKLKEVELMVTIGKLSYMCQAVDISSEEHVSNVVALLKTKTV